MRSFEDLVAEAEAADMAGWDFTWLDGRAIEERPPWGYSRLLAERLATVERALDIDTGGGEVLNEASVLPRRMTVTESWPPNASRARTVLEPRGVHVVETREGAPLPFEDRSFDLVSARHPVRPDWREIHRVLRPGGHYFAQHVGPSSAFELIERLLGPLPEARLARDPRGEVADAERAGLAVEQMRTARCRMEFFDIGAVVWILRKCVWWVPGFSVARHEDSLRQLDRGMRQGAPFVAHSTRHLIDARRSAPMRGPERLVLMEAAGHRLLEPGLRAAAPQASRRGREARGALLTRDPPASSDQPRRTLARFTGQG